MCRQLLVVLRAIKASSRSGEITFALLESRLINSFFLGVVEAPLFPGAIYVMSCWYTRREMAFRCALLYTGQTLAFCVAGLIAAAVFATLEGQNGLAGWQWLFIVLAVTGAGLAVVALFVLPDYPHSKTGSARWSMTEDMRIIAAARIAADRVSTTHAKAGVLQGLKMSVFDWKMWFLVSVFNAELPSSC